MKKFQGFKIPEKLDIQLDQAVKRFNDDRKSYCAEGCMGISCSDCICCCNLRDNDVSIAVKIKAFGDYARLHGKTITRTDYTGEDLPVLIARHPDVCASDVCASDDIDNEDDSDMIEKTCAYCDSSFTTDDEDADLCEDCQSRYDDGELRRCDNCGEYTADYVIPCDTDAVYCDDCASINCYHCDDCGDWYRYGHNVRSDDSITICDHCYDNGWYTCEDCGCLISEDHAYWTEDDDVYCESCFNDRGCCLIHGYSYKPDPDFRKTDEDAKNPVYLGFELEAGDTEHSEMIRAAEFIDETTALAYLKEDASIPSYGFEMVSHPLTYLYHKNKCSWEAILHKMSECGLQSHDASRSCGLHVHVNRNALTPNQWIIVDWFIHREQAKWETIARRSSEYYAKFKQKHDDQKITTFYGRGYDRYTAVNFTNRNTVEFRLFRGTLRYSTFIATLALVDALISWAKTIKTHDILCTGAWESYVETIKSDAKYDVALEYLKEKQLINKED